MSGVRVDIEQTVDAFGGREIIVISKWYSSEAWLGVLLFPFLSLLLLLLGSGLGEPAFMEPPIFVSFFLLAGLWLLVGYWTLATFVNRTTIRLGRTFSVRHGPLPWRGNLEVDIARIDRFDVQPFAWFYHNGRFRRVGQACLVRLTGGLIHGFLPGDLPSAQTVSQALNDALHGRRGPEPALERNLG